jgi:hypothetical protein
MHEGFPALVTYCFVFSKYVSSIFSDGLRKNKKPSVSRDIYTGKVVCCWLFQIFVHIIMAYLFPKDTYNITVFPLLAQPADTLSFKMKILYWIEYKQLLDV